VGRWWIARSNRAFLRFPACMRAPSMRTDIIESTFQQLFNWSKQVFVREPRAAGHSIYTFHKLLFPDLKKANLNLRHRIARLTFCLCMDNSICHRELKVVSKFEKHHISRLPYPSYSPCISPRDFMFFGGLKEILAERAFTLEILHFGGIRTLRTAHGRSRGFIAPDHKSGSTGLLLDVRKGIMRVRGPSRTERNRLRQSREFTKI
jgi:hypothetical protein